MFVEEISLMKKKKRFNKTMSCKQSFVIQINLKKSLNKHISLFMKNLVSSSFLDIVNIVSIIYISFIDVIFYSQASIE
jgi:hypothetical protein